MSLADIGHGAQIADGNNYAESSDYPELIAYCRQVENIPGASLLYGSALEIGRLVRALENGEILSEASLAMMNSPVTPAYEGLWYGVGMFISEKGWIGHGGTAGNYRSAITYDPENRLTLVRCSRIQNQPDSEPLSENILEEIRKMIP